MIKLFTLLMFIASLCANAGDAVIWYGSCAKILPTDGLCFPGADTKGMLSLSVDPSIAPGKTASIGSTAMVVVGGVGQLWIKTGAANTAWSQVAITTSTVTGSGTTGQITKWTGTTTVGNATADVDYVTPSTLSGYAFLAGRSGGQVLNGGTGSGESLTLKSTADATQGPISLVGSSFRFPSITLTGTNFTSALPVSMGQLRSGNEIGDYVNEQATAKAIVSTNTGTAALTGYSYSTIDGVFNQGLWGVRGKIYRQPTNDTTDVSNAGGVGGRVFFSVPTGKTLTTTTAIRYAALQADPVSLTGGGSLALSRYASINVPTDNTVTGTSKYALFTGAMSGATNNYQLYLGTGTSVLNDTTDAISASTGSMFTLGGIGVAKSIYSGSTITGLQFQTSGTSAITISGNQFSSSVPISITNTTPSTSTTTGALTVAGGMGVGGDQWIGGNARVGNITSLATNERVTINTVKASNDSSVSLGIAHEQAFSGALTSPQTASYVRLKRTFNSNYTDTASSFVHRGQLQFSSTSSTLTTGSLLHSVYTAVSPLFSGSPTLALNGYASFNAEANSINTGVNKYGLYVGDQTGATNNYSIYTGTGLVRIGDTTASASSTTGALTVAGGVGVAGDQWVGGKFKVGGNVEVATQEKFSSYENSTTNQESAAIVGSLRQNFSGNLSTAHYGIVSSTLRAIDANRTDSNIFSAFHGFMTFALGNFNLSATNSFSHAMFRAPKPAISSTGGVLSLVGYSSFHVDPNDTATGTNKYGLYIGNQTGATNNYSIYTGTAPSYFGGNISSISTISGASFSTSSLTLTGTQFNSSIPVSFTNSVRSGGAIGDYTNEQISSFANIATNTSTSALNGYAYNSFDGALSTSLTGLRGKMFRAITNDQTDTTTGSAISLRSYFDVPSGKTLTTSSAIRYAGALIQPITFSGGGTLAIDYASIYVNADSTTISKSKYGLAIGNITGGANNYQLSLGTGRSVFADTNDSTSTTTGSISTSGGIGVAKSIYAGGTISGLQFTTTGQVFSSATNVNGVVSAGSIKIADTSATASTAGAGSVKYTSTGLQYSDGSNWNTIGGLTTTANFTGVSVTLTGAGFQRHRYTGSSAQTLTSIVLTSAVDAAIFFIACTSDTNTLTIPYNTTGIYKQNGDITCGAGDIIQYMYDSTLGGLVHVSGGN